MFSCRGSLHNISNPSSPILAGSCDLSAQPSGVDVLGNYAYVADGVYGLQIINVSDPSSPTLAGSYDTPGYTSDVYAQGDYVYVADWYSGRKIINVSNPSSPTLAGSFYTSQRAAGVYVSGNYNYVANGYGGLFILTLNYDTTPPNPPTNLTATAISPSQINLSWAASTDNESGSGLAGYKIERAPDQGGSPGPFTQIGTSPTNSYSDMGLPPNILLPNTKYWYRVRAYDNAGNDSAYSENKSRTTLSDPPTLAVATDGTYPNKINVSWQGSVTANHYHVYRDGVSGVGALVYNLSGTSFDDIITGTHTYYIYSANSEDKDSAGYAHDEGSTTAVPAPPTMGTPIALSTTSIRGTSMIMPPMKKDLD